MSGLVMPPMLYGTAWKGARTKELVVQAISTGFRGIDTACQPKHYHQPGVGEALKVLQGEHGIKREEIWLQTKYTPLSGQDAAKPLPYDPKAPLAERVRQSLSTSFRELGVSYLDALILHSPMSTRAEHAEVWKQFEAFVHEGKVRHLGISNIYDAGYLEWIFETATVKPSIMRVSSLAHPVQVHRPFLGNLTSSLLLRSQNRWYAEVDYGRDILALCEKYGAKFQSFWTLTGNPHLLKSPLLARLASFYRAPSSAAALYTFLMRRRAISPLNGTTNEGHMREAVEDMRKVEEAGQLTGEGADELEKAEMELEKVLWG
ncbi:hypothetical protein JCM11251_000162 [Rhodosporidiobolus azoricus]